MFSDRVDEQDTETGQCESSAKFPTTTVTDPQFLSGKEETDEVWPKLSQSHTHCCVHRMSPRLPLQHSCPTPLSFLFGSISPHCELLWKWKLRVIIHNSTHFSITLLFLFAILHSALFLRTVFLFLFCFSGSPTASGDSVY